LLYQEWGFIGSPFQTTSLPPSELGERLLVGRARELESLERKISSAPKIATLEGLNGVGKTSIVNIAAYRLFDRHLRSEGQPLYIPARKIFQLSPNQALDSFIDSALMEIAQTLIDKASEIQKSGTKIQTKPLDRWLNSPQLSSFQGGAWVVQVGTQRETNTSSGFERSGFRKAVLGWLEEIFPEAASGGIICTIDNLELLQSSEYARSLLLCGALGIVYGVVASPRLEGYLHKPIEVSGIDDRYAPDILTSRITAYALNPSESYLPLRPADFAHLYDLLKGNLRSVLSYADDYCQHVGDLDREPYDDNQKADAFSTWLKGQCKIAYEACRQELRPKALEVFRNAASFGGIFSPSDFVDFGFNSIPAFRPHIRDLEAAGLVVSTQDDGDKRRKTIQITPKGWLVYAYNG